MNLRLDQPVQEPPAIGSQICLSSDCHCSSHIWSNLWSIFLQWQSEAWQLWLLMADSSCTDWSNLRSIVPIYEVYRYNNKSIITFLNSSTLGTRALLMTLRLYLVPYGKNEHCLWNEEEDESRRWRIQINSLHLLICTFINLYDSCRTMSISFKLHLYVLHPYLPTMGGRAHWGAQILN